MKTYKHVLAAIALVVILSWSAIGGEIHTNGAADPPPPPPTGTSIVAAEQPSETLSPESESSFSEIALNLIQIFLTVR